MIKRARHLQPLVRNKEKRLVGRKEFMTMVLLYLFTYLKEVQVVMKKTFFSASHVN